MELYFTDGANRRIPFSAAVHRHPDGRWLLQSHAQVRFSFGEQDRPGLGGRPGAWRKYYGTRSPKKHDYDPDLVVMNWDYKARRGRVVGINVLRSLLGEGWRARLRELRDEAVQYSTALRRGRSFT